MDGRSSWDTREPVVMTAWSDGLTLAGVIVPLSLDKYPVESTAGRLRHVYGDGPFAVLRMPALPASPGLYLWCLSGAPVYVGQTRGTLRSRLGPNGYSRISTYNTFAREPGRTNGGQQTNCRINGMANAELRAGQELTLWYRVTAATEALEAEAEWMRRNGLPPWNRQDRR
jgi:hypothetical protein